jgi:hypothetical protein
MPPPPPVEGFESGFFPDLAPATVLQPGDSVQLLLGEELQLSIASNVKASLSRSGASLSLSSSSETVVSIAASEHNNWITVIVPSTPDFAATKLSSADITFGTADIRSGVAQRVDGTYMYKTADYNHDGLRDIQFYFDNRKLTESSGKEPALESMYLLGTHPDAGAFRGGEAAAAAPAPKQWMSLNTEVASITSDGIVQAKGLGTTRLAFGTALSADTVVAIVASPPPPPLALPGAGLATVASLPRAVVETSMPTMTGKVIRVAAGGDLQAALNAALPGDVVELEAGAVFQGSFTLRPKSGEGWIVIRSSEYAQLPEGRRVGPADAAHMAKLVGGQRNQRVLQTAAGAHHYRVVGIEIAVAESGVPDLINTIVEFGAKGQTLETMPHHLILDRTYVHGTQTQSLQRCVVLNSAWSAVIESHLAECHADGFDSQAIAGWNGTGPYKIQNNYLAGAGENIMFGGAGVGPEGIPPADIEIRGNHIHKPLSWKDVWSVKNLFELKIAERVLVEGNTFENNWADGQVGFAVNVKSENRNVTAYPDLATRDVTFRNNRILNSRFGATIIGGASTQAKTGEGRTERIVMQNNYWQVEDRAFQMSGVANVILERNTAFGRVNLEGMLINLEMRDNLFTGPVKGSGVPEGSGALDQRAPGAIFLGNAIVGADSGRYPAGNEFPATLASYTGSAGVMTSVLEKATAGR